MACSFFVMALSAMASGCVVNTYQPMSGLHQPLLVDTRVGNFQDTYLDVHCIPGDALNGEAASALCRKVQILFENQGAFVTTHQSAGRTNDHALTGTGPVAAPPPGAAVLTVELRERQIHASNHPLSWVLCVGSFTLLPGVQDYTFAQEVVVRDGSGFLLATDSFEGRLVRRFGFGNWAGHAILDLFRDEQDKMVGEVADRDISADMYGQLSQLVFNAKMHAQVLGLSRPPAPAARPARVVE